MRKTLSKHLFDVLLILALFAALAGCVHSCIGCRAQLERLKQTKEYEIPNFKIN